MKGCPLPGRPITVSMVPVGPAFEGKRHLDQASEQPPLDAATAARPGTAGIIYVVAFITGAIVMSFEMLGSRYLNPYFGSGIYTWAALISTVLIALTAGYFLGGALADRTPSPAVLALTVIVGSLYLLALPSFAQAVLEFVLESVDGTALVVV